MKKNIAKYIRICTQINANIVAFNGHCCINKSGIICLIWVKFYRNPDSINSHKLSLAIIKINRNLFVGINDSQLKTNQLYDIQSVTLFAVIKKRQKRIKKKKTTTSFRSTVSQVGVEREQKKKTLRVKSVYYNTIFVWIYIVGGHIVDKFGNK